MKHHPIENVCTAVEEKVMEIDIGVNTSEREIDPCSRSHPAARNHPKDFHIRKSVNLDEYEMHMDRGARVSLLACLGRTYSSFLLRFIGTPGQKNELRTQHQVGDDQQVPVP